MTKEALEKKIEVTTPVETAPTPLTLEERLAEVNTIISDINTVLTKGEVPSKDSLELLDDAIKEYNKMLREAEYDKFLAESNPVLTALKQGTVTQIRRKIKRGSDNTPDKYETANTWAVVNLPEMDSYTKDKIFISSQWIQRISLWNNALKAWKADNLGDVDAVHAMKNLIKSLNSDEDVEANFTFSGKISKNLLVKTAQVIADNIVVNPDKDAKPFIFEGKDVEFVALAFKASNKDVLKYTGIRDETCITMFTRAMHRIVTGGTYTVEETK